MATRKKKKGTKKSGKAMESLVVTSKVKAAIKKNKMNVAGDAMQGLNGWLYWLVDQACNRAKENGRKTVRSHDFLAGH